MINDKSKKIIPAAFVFMFVALSFVIANTFGNTYAAGIILKDSYPESEAEAACASLGDWVYMEKSEGYGYIMCCPASDNTITAPGFTPNYGKCQTQKYSDGSCPSEYTSSSSAYCDATAKYFKVQGSNYLTVTFNPDGGELYDDGDKLIEEYVTSYTINYTDEEFNYSYFYAKRGDEEFFTGWTLNNCDNAKETGTYSGSDENITLKACYVDGVWVTFHNKKGAEYSKVLVEPGTKIPKDQLPDIIDPTGADATGWWSTGLNACDDQHAFVVSKEIVTEDMDLYPCYGGPTDEDYEDDDSGKSGSGSGDSSGSGNAGSGDSSGSGSETTYILTLHTDGGDLYYNDREYSKKFFELSSFNYSDFYAEKAGHKFIGWDTDDSCDTPVDSRKKTLTKDMDLYACYNKESTGGSDNSGGTNTDDDNNSGNNSGSDNNDNNNNTDDDTNIDNNPGTGSFMLYITFLIGILALGYTGYSVFKYVKNND